MIVDPTGELADDTASVGATNWNGGLTATRHLLALGHTRIAVVGGPEDILCSRARVDGFRAAMDAAGVAIDPELVSHGRFHVEEGIDRARILLQMPDPPTAILTGDDLQALGVYQVARDLRLHIPEDLSVVGFDDLPVARWVGPPLTTIRQPLVEMAETAAELVLAHRSRGTDAAGPGRAVHRAHRPGKHRPTEPLTAAADDRSAWALGYFAAASWSADRSRDLAALARGSIRATVHSWPQRRANAAASRRRSSIRTHAASWCGSR